MWSHNRTSIGLFHEDLTAQPLKSIFAYCDCLKSTNLLLKAWSCNSWIQHYTPPYVFFGCRLMWSSNHLYTKLCNHQNQQQLLRPGCCSLDVIDLGDMGFGVSPSILYCTVLCIHSINIMLQPSFLLAGRRKEWPCFLSVLSTWFKSDFFAHSAPSCMISHNQLVFSSSPSYVRKVNICPKHLSNVDRTGGWRHFSWSFWVGLGGGRRRVSCAESMASFCSHCAISYMISC